jgi:hypothetical protein
LDYEVAVLQGFASALSEVDARKLKGQIARYDRIDRSPNRRFQRFIDDDSDFQRRDWPTEILFSSEGTVHCADVTVSLVSSSEICVKARAFLWNGRFDGCEFFPAHTHGRQFEEISLGLASSQLDSVQTPWVVTQVKLYAPFSSTFSKIVFE